MATDAFVAIDGDVTVDGTQLCDVRDITVNRVKEEKTYASSCTAGKLKRLTGHQDINGSFVGYLPSSPAGPDDILGFDEGDDVLLLIVSKAGQTLFNDQATITEIEYGVPVEGGDIVEFTVTWGRT